jgi:type VI secretion system protein VasD
MVRGAWGFGAVVITAVLGVLAGCGSAPVLPPVNVNVTGSVEASASVNPDPNGRPSPLALKIFQLRSLDKFESAGFFSLFDEAETALGADLLGVDELTLAPGQSTQYAAEFNPQTRFVGVIGAYRDINQANWRAAVAMPEAGPESRPLMIKADRLAISVSAAQ